MRKKMLRIDNTLKELKDILSSIGKKGNRGKEEGEGVVDYVKEHLSSWPGQKFQVYCMVYLDNFTFGVQYFTIAIGQNTS